jgi:hypothetical protein
VLALSLPVAAIAYAHTERSQADAFAGAMSQVAIVAPTGRPPLTQESIDLALALYGVRVPTTAEHPVLDMKLADRGLTMRATFLEKAVVTVGPAAFASWGLLGSTLAHELEIHCQQNFLAIYFMDTVGLDGTGAAERQAYLHELANAERFGLARFDAQLIADTMDYFYPETGPSAFVGPKFMPRSVRNWLAKNVIHGASGL